MLFLPSASSQCGGDQSSFCHYECGGPRDDDDDNNYDDNTNSNKTTSSGSEKSAGDLYLMKCKPDGRSYA